jgi:uncharacterized damage-inducible protein DinB
VNVLDPGGREALVALGARSLPVVSRGREFVFAQVIRDVVQFLGLDEDTDPQLSPTELAERYDDVLEHAVGLVRQMPDECLSRELPNRPRSWRVLLHHVFQIPTAFLDMEASGEPFSYEAMVAPPPQDMDTSGAIADFGDAVRERFRRWWQEQDPDDFQRNIEVYFGESSRHEMLERVVWHSTQHVRQVMSLLEQAGVTPERPLTAAHIRGLPLTDRIWDET